MAKVKIIKIVKIVQNWCLGQGSPLPCSCYRPAAGATLQGLCRKGYADDDAHDDKDDDDDGDDMMLLICSLKVVGAQRGSVLNLERYRAVRRPPFKSGAAVHVEHAEPCGQCSGWSMVICVASATLGAC